MNDDKYRLFGLDDLPTTYCGEVVIKTVASGPRNKLVLIKIANKVFCNKGYVRDARILASLKARDAFARLIGIPIAEMKAATAAHMRNIQALQREEEVAELRMNAKELGFTLIEEGEPV